MFQELSVLSVYYVHHLFALCYSLMFSVLDCDEVYRTGGMRYPGTYMIQIQPTHSDQPFTVLCQSLYDAGMLTYSLIECLECVVFDIFSDLRI